jgi:hypothetical protein
MPLVKPVNHPGWKKFIAVHKITVLCHFESPVAVNLTNYVSVMRMSLKQSYDKNLKMINSISRENFFLAMIGSTVENRIYA